MRRVRLPFLKYNSMTEKKPNYGFNKQKTVLSPSCLTLMLGKFLPSIPFSIHFWLHTPHWVTGSSDTSLSPLELEFLTQLCQPSPSGNILHSLASHLIPDYLLQKPFNSSNRKYRSFHKIAFNAFIVPFLPTSPFSISILTFHLPEFG